MSVRYKQAPVITIDGPSGTGKGTIAVKVAQALHWNLLDSGFLYRTITLAIFHHGIILEDTTALTYFLKNLQISNAHQIYDKKAKINFGEYDIMVDIRSEKCGTLTSKFSALPIVRETVLQYQYDFRQWPGLVADGRDMGTVVFPDAILKFYFNADLKERVYRRYKQLRERGINVNLCDIQGDLEERDHNDATRSVSPAKPAIDAIVIDTTRLGIEAVFMEVMSYVWQHGIRQR